ncbi:hypothetical protein ACFLXC_06965 [Chloroflexota bacterium]
MIISRRRNYQLGGSKAITYPGDVVVGEEATIAGNRLLLIDPKGEIDEKDLADFLETHIEPLFEKWWREKQAARRPTVQGVMPMQKPAPVAEEVLQAAETRSVIAGPQVYLVNCWRCAGQIAWRLDLGIRGACPYCGAGLKLISQ